MEDTLYTTLERQGNITIITQSTKANRRCRAKKISKDEYVNLTTGEVCQYQNRSENRSQCRRSLARTFEKIRGIVNANATDPKKVRFITLTYEEPTEDTKQLYRDFSAFWKRFVRWSKKKGFEKPEYLVVCEPNAPNDFEEYEEWKQRFHFHLLLFYENKAPFLPNEEIAEVWSLGYTWTTKVDDVSNVGAYLSAYLTDTLIDEEDEEGNKKQVRAKKTRYFLYEKNFNIYRTSRNVKRPVKTQISERTANEYRMKHTATFSTMKTIRNEKANFETTIFREWFNEAEEGFPQSEKRNNPRSEDKD